VRWSVSQTAQFYDKTKCVRIPRGRDWEIHHPYLSIRTLGTRSHRRRPQHDYMIEIFSRSLATMRRQYLDPLPEGRMAGRRLLHGAGPCQVHVFLTSCEIPTKKTDRSVSSESVKKKFLLCKYINHSFARRSSICRCRWSIVESFTR
jgi:hypothetical protein